MAYDLVYHERHVSLRNLPRDEFVGGFVQHSGTMETGKLYGLTLSHEIVRCHPRRVSTRRLFCRQPHAAADTARIYGAPDAKLP